MNWVKKHKLLAVKVIQFNGWPCIELNDLWNAIHSSFNSTLSCEVDLYLLDEIPDRKPINWTSFASKELINTIEKCKNSSAPGPDKLTWGHIKKIIRSKECITRLIDIANAYIKLGHWPHYFKTSMTFVIPKLNKASYNTPKSFWPIILLNIIGKLFEKIIREWLQLYMISNLFIYCCQLGGFKHRSTTDTGVVLTHSICTGWIKNLTTSTLAFDIAQFYPSLNH